MEGPKMIREITEEVAQRMTGGPDAIGAKDLVDAANQKDEDWAYQAAWDAWLASTTALQGLGFSPRTLCDTVNTIAEVHQEFESRTRETA